MNFVKLPIIILIVFNALFFKINDNHKKASQQLKQNNSELLDTISQRYLFIGKNQIAKLNIAQIRVLLNKDDCNRDDSSLCFTLYTFVGGMLKTELSFDGLKSNINQANDLAYNFFYKKDKSGNYRLDVRNGDAYNGPSQQDHINTYKYDAKGLLINEIYKQGLLTYERTEFRGKKRTTTYQLNTTYAYDLNGRLTYNKAVGSDDNKASFTHYLYKDNSLIGYYPAKRESDLGIDHSIADSIYYGNKMLELNKIGFDNFKKKYFTPEIYKKVIEDCYEPVKSNQLLINNKPITTFLSKIGKSGVKHIVFEIADNYFLFYKLID